MDAKFVKLHIQNLNCFHCASVIEEKLKALTTITDLNCNFVAGFVSFNVKEDYDKKDVVLTVKKIILDIEPDVLVDYELTPKKFNFFSKDNIIFFIGLLVYLIAIIIHHYQDASIFAICLYVLAYGLLGYKIILKALKNIKKGDFFDENFLMIVATIGAFAITDYSEAVAVMIFYRIGEFFQDYAVEKSRHSIKSLLNIKPDHANLLIDDEVRVVDPNVVEIDSIIIIKPGEKIPLDGIILEGESYLDTQAISGESLPQTAGVGDIVYSGSININQVIKVKTTSSFANSTVMRILDLIENASQKKAVTEQFITKFARVYTPIVLFIALLTFIVPTVFFNQDMNEMLYRSLIFLVVSCPCALVISIPLGFFGGIGKASSKGILIKGANYLEALNKIDSIYFDKTGTLTMGKFALLELVAFNNYNDEDLLRYAAICEKHSTHPIAKSIIDTYTYPISEDIYETIEEIKGFGMLITLKDQTTILSGNIKLMQKYAINCPENNAIGTVIHVAINNIYAGYIVIDDEIKWSSPKAIEQLRALKITNLSLLTGDTQKTADRLNETLKLDYVYAGLLPEDKLNILEHRINTKTKNQNVVFVGDGINDAPTLMRADIGIAMGGLGSDAAIEASDIVLMADDPYQIVEAIVIAKKTREIIIQNIILALAIKVLVLLLATTGTATMWEAVFADVGVALLTVLNTLRILK